MILENKNSGTMSNEVCLVVILQQYLHMYYVHKFEDQIFLL